MAVHIRVLAVVWAARHRVAALRSRTQCASWRSVLCTVLREDTNWLRLRIRGDGRRRVDISGVWSPRPSLLDR